MRVYIAGPMRGIDKYNFPAFDAAAAYLRALGHDPVNPADLDRDIGVNENTVELPENFIQDALRRDFYEICTCDAIAFLPGWEQSSGARAERYVAEKIGCLIYHIVPWASFKPEVAPIIVGLSGYAQSGKDTSGAMMAELAGFERIAFADALKTVAEATDPEFKVFLGTGTRTADGEWRHVNNYSVRPLSRLLEEGGWEHAKSHVPQSRVFLQHLGHAVREHVDPLAWVNAALNKTKPGGRYVITDLRYENEFDAIKARGGYVVRVERPGTGPANAHVSETALDGYEWDAILRNTGSLDDLKARVRLFLSTL